MNAPQCMAVEWHGTRFVSCGMKDGHLPPHYDPALRIWWSVEKHETPGGHHERPA